jgi:glycosyltransferase involved in cell wall biosynthesis
MRVTHVYRYSYPPLHGGIEQSIHTLVHQLKRQVDPRVLVSGSRPGFQDDFGVPIRSTGALGHLVGSPISPDMPLWLRRERASLFHFHMPNPTGEMSYLLAGCPAPAVATYHMETVRYAAALKLYRPFLDLFLSRLKRIIVSTPQHITNSAILPRFKDKCRIIPFGIDTRRFEPTPEVMRRADELRARFGGPLALFIGKLRHYKGLDYLLRALAQTNGRLMVVGDGEEKERLHALCQDLKLTGRVAWLPHLENEEFLATLHACDVFVLPSIYRTETFGIAQLEAQACGKPVICTALGTGVEYVNLHGRTGLVVKPADAEALAAALERLFSDADYRAELGRNAYERVQAEFTQERMAASILQVYEEALAA